MKLAAIGLTAVLTLGLGATSPASALDVQVKTTLGAPLYTGPNVVIVTRDGHGYRHAPQRYKYGHPYGKRARGYDERRYDSRGRHHGYNRHGYDRFGYDRYGYDRYGYDRQGYDRHGFDRRGFDRRGYPRHAYGRERHPPAPYYGNHTVRPDPHGRDRYDRGPRLRILGASYRSIDGRACDAFAHVHKRCDGDDSCKVKASNKICGDPDRGRLKVLEVTYACGNRQFQSRTPERSSSRLRCR